MSIVKFNIAVAAGALLLVFATAYVSPGSFSSDRTSAQDRSLPQQPTPAPAQPATPIIVNWTTKSEVNTVGFNLYRAESAGGPFVLINRELIPASNDPIAGGTYVFTDTNVVAGVTYYYQLEDVDVSGTRTRYDKLISATASAQSAGLLGAPFPIAIAGAAGLMLVVCGIVLWQLRRR